MLALLSKTAVAPLPLVLLRLAWWRRGKVTGRDVWRSAPFFAASLVLGLVTVWFERHQTAAFEIVRDDSFWSRLAGAGWAVWFYLYKALLPLNLILIYPRWQIDPARRRSSYVPGACCWWEPCCCCGAIVGGGAGSGSFASGLLCGDAVAGPGVREYWFHALLAGGRPLAVFCDHGTHRVVSAGLATFFTTAGKRARWAGGSRWAVPWCCLLGGLAWRQSALFTDPDTFWRATVAANPDCGYAHFILGDLLSDQGRLDEAIAHYQKGLELQPDDAFAHNNFGNALHQKGQIKEALAQYRKALELQPSLAWANCNLGAIFLQQGQVDEAIAQFQRALKMKLLMHRAPNVAPVGRAQIHYLLGSALTRKGLTDEAITHYREALANEPDLAEAHYQLAAALLGQRQLPEASQHFLAGRPSQARLGRGAQ